MKKRLIALLMIGVTTASITACGGKTETEAQVTTELNTDTQESVASIESESSETELQKITDIAETTAPETVSDEPQNSYTIDGITVTANNFSVEPYEDPNGEYTKKINVYFTFTNDTDSAFGYMVSCEGYLPDGFKLKSWADISDMDLKQIPAHGSIDMTAYLLSDDTVNLNQITVVYPFMDYNEEYWDDFGKIMTGEMGQEEYESKYGNPTELNFQILPQ